MKISKVDDARQVSRLGKSVNERAHLLCGASVGPLPVQAISHSVLR